MLRTTMKTRFYVLGAALLYITSFIFFGVTHAAGCPSGTRPATADDAAVKNGTIEIGRCYNLNEVGIGQNAEQAKQYLRSILCPPDRDNYGGRGPDGTIRGLDAKFAVCAAKFLKSARDSGTNVCISEGARSVEKQNEYVRRGVLACKKGAACEHPRGIAIDVNVRPNTNNCASYRNLHQAAPQFGLKFYLGCRDAYHFVPTGSGCNAGGVVPPPSTDTSSPNTPSSPLSDSIRRALGQQPPMPAQPPAQPQMPAQSPSPQQPSLSAQPTISSEAPTVTPVSNLININVPTATGSLQVASTSPVPRATSTFDLISAYANPVSELISVDVGTGTPVSLNPDIKDGVSLNPTSQNGVRATGTATSAQSPAAPQTFTSGDLANNVSPSAVGQNTFLLRLLDTMKGVLLYAIDYLRPFGHAAGHLE